MYKVYPVLIILLFSSICSCGDVEAILSNLDATLLDVIWCGNNSQDSNNVLLLSSKGTVYKSSDKGEKWEKMTEVFTKKAIQTMQDTSTSVKNIFNFYSIILI